MLLENFRKTRVIWDRASQQIQEFTRASSSDNHGRKLSVTVTDEGREVNLTGSTLSLYWETNDKTGQGLDYFVPVDITKGQFEIYYTPEMLSNIGYLKASLVLIGSSGSIVSEAFRITVFKGIDEGAVVGQASFTALTEALAQVGELEEKYAPRLNAVEINKADQAFVDSQFATIVSGAPKGTYTSVSALQSAYPNGTDGIFLVLDTGHWYYWQSTTSEWTDGGVYQASQIEDGAIEFEKLSLNLQSIFNDWVNLMTEENESWVV